jgi:hypothetical protein
LRLAKLGIDVKMKEFNLMPHGFLSYNIPIWGMRNESMEGITVGNEWIKELLELDLQPLVSEISIKIDKQEESFILVTEQQYSKTVT